MWKRWLKQLSNRPYAPELRISICVRTCDVSCDDKKPRARCASFASAQLFRAEMAGQLLSTSEWDMVLGKMLRYHFTIGEEIRVIIQQIRKEMKEELVPLAEEKANYGKVRNKTRPKCELFFLRIRGSPWKSRCSSFRSQALPTSITVQVAREYEATVFFADRQEEDPWYVESRIRDWRHPAEVPREPR